MLLPLYAIAHNIRYDATYFARRVIATIRMICVIDADAAIRYAMPHMLTLRRLLYYAVHHGCRYVYFSFTPL